MAKSETNLFKSLRARGVRKKIAKQVTRATSGTGGKSKIARRAMADLNSVVEDVGDRLRHGPEKRSAAAEKAGVRAPSAELGRTRART